jgi:hypothetical protein
MILPDVNVLVYAFRRDFTPACDLSCVARGGGDERCPLWLVAIGMGRRRSGHYQSARLPDARAAASTALISAGARRSSAAGVHIPPDAGHREHVLSWRPHRDENDQREHESTVSTVGIVSAARSNGSGGDQAILARGRINISRADDADGADANPAFVRLVALASRGCHLNFGRRGREVARYER